MTEAADATAPKMSRSQSFKTWAHNKEKKTYLGGRTGKEWRESRSPGMHTAHCHRCHLSGLQLQMHSIVLARRLDPIAATSSKPPRIYSPSLTPPAALNHRCRQAARVLHHLPQLLDHRPVRHLLCRHAQHATRPCLGGPQTPQPSPQPW